MKHLLLSLSLCFALVGGASAQVVTAKGSKSDETMIKIRQIDMINQILPLVIRKEQYNPLLSAIEKARQNEKKIRELEDGDLATLAPKVDTTVKDALDKGAYPDHSTMVEASKLLKAMAIRRQVALGEMVDMVYEAVDKTFDAGQKKVMANSVDAFAAELGLKKDEMTDTQKIKLYIKRVLLDQITYELLLKLQKTAA